ncbi:MAG: DUF1634 domain-containing protein [Bdellovibrionaceae bacterium]|nr:DUF1634 domain-containing protein [Pseudobdellovibrionaceae bacterium]
MNKNIITLEYRISKLLRYGVMLAGALMFVGWMSMLDFTQNPLLAFHDYREVTFVHSIGYAWRDKVWGLLTAYAGLILLISLPLSRVLMTAILFWRQKERLLSGIAFFVFAALIISFSLGIEL